MLNIDAQNNITLTRGDTLTLTVTLLHEVDPVPPATEPTIEPYVPVEGDVIRFAVSKGYKSEPGYELQFAKEIPHDTLTFTASSTERKSGRNTLTLSNSTRILWSGKTSSMG